MACLRVLRKHRSMSFLYQCAPNLRPLSPPSISLFTVSSLPPPHQQHVVCFVHHIFSSPSSLEFWKFQIVVINLNLFVGCDPVNFLLLKFGLFSMTKSDV
jgi:hypothetical protein